VADAPAADFELTGGALCLDFANTLGDRPLGHAEHLPDFAALVAFGRQAGLLEPGAARALLRGAAARPRQAQRAFRRALELRECLYRVFAAVARGGKPEPADLAALNRELARALPRGELRPQGAGFAWAWPGGAGDPESVLWPVARSAADLLVSRDRPPLRECASGSCSWLFLDESRGARRRWCDMKVCGNRQKARRHYRRVREAAAAGRR
jgi:predicted RNA-binding Zn ribbon-like protein